MELNREELAILTIVMNSELHDIRSLIEKRLARGHTSISRKEQLAEYTALRDKLECMQIASRTGD
jgi:hypothetical protein